MRQSRALKRTFALGRDLPLAMRGLTCTPSYGHAQATSTMTASLIHATLLAPSW